MGLVASLFLPSVGGSGVWMVKDGWRAGIDFAITRNCYPAEGSGWSARVPHLQYQIQHRGDGWRVGIDFIPLKRWGEVGLGWSRMGGGWE